MTTVEKPYARIGSHEGSEVVLAARGVPRRGLYLHATDAGVFCVRLRDEGPRAGLFRGWLLPHQATPLGPYRVSAHLAEGNESPGAGGPDLEARGSAEAPYPVVAVSFAGREVARRRLRRRLTVVGRCRPSTLPIWGGDLSAPHLAFYWEAGILWVIDLLSRRGTWLDGAPVEVAQLPLGRSLTLGEVVLNYSGLAGAPTQAAGALVPEEMPLHPQPVAADPGQRALRPMEQVLAQLLAQMPGQSSDWPQQGSMVPAGQMPEAVGELCGPGGGKVCPGSAFAMLFVQWAADQLAHEREWLELAAQRQAIEARLQEQLAAMERLRMELEHRQNTLEIQQERLVLEQRALEFERTRTASGQPGEVQRRGELQECLGPQAGDADPRVPWLDLDRSTSSPQPGNQRPPREDASPESASATRPATERPPQGEEGEARAGPVPPPGSSASANGAGRFEAGAAAGAQEDFSQAYNQLLERLITISRQRSSWWNRVKDSLSGFFGSTDRQPDPEHQKPKPPAP